MVEWGNPETFWLNVTNAALGLVTLIAFVVVVGSAVVEVIEKVNKRVTSAAEDAHILAFPALGTTMADGGEKVGETEAEGEEEDEPVS
ncbi:MAG TPA: hypothetical protein VIY27_01115 [Myxococcota bacterium]